MATAEMLDLLSAEEFGKRPDPGFPEELVRGRVVAMTVPDRRHGYVCLNVGRILGDFVAKRGAGRVMSNDSGIITAQIRTQCGGLTLLFTASIDCPRGRWRRLWTRGSRAGRRDQVSRATGGAIFTRKSRNTSMQGSRRSVVLDPGPETAHVFTADDAPGILTADDDFVLTGILEGFASASGSSSKGRYASERSPIPRERWRTCLAHGISSSIDPSRNRPKPRFTSPVSWPARASGFGSGPGRRR